MKYIRNLSLTVFLASSVVIAVPVQQHGTMSHGRTSHGATGGLHAMPSTVTMPMQQSVNQPMNQPSVLVTQPIMQQSMAVQQGAQPVVVSDQVFLQNTMNKLLGDKLKIMREKVEKYKKIIQNNATILEQKIKALFA